MQKTDNTGFTLVEVLTVLAIVALLAVLAYPSYQDSIRKSKRAEGKTALMKLMQQEERYYSQNTTYIIFSSASTEENEKKFRWYSAENPKSSAYEISAKACSDDTIQSCVVLTAKPGTDQVDAAYTDAHCGNLALTSTGIRSADNVDCW